MYEAASVGGLPHFNLLFGAVIRLEIIPSIFSQLAESINRPNLQWELAEGAAHPLRIAKTGRLRDPFDRFTGVHARCRATSIRKRSTAFDDVSF
jgi:hypothetical protein